MYQASGAVGVRLYYGSEENNIKELIWEFGRDAWDTTYVWLLNGAGQLELRWYDFNTTANSTWTTGKGQRAPFRLSLLVPGLRRFTRCET
jgi:hypothetical protein